MSARSVLGRYADVVVTVPNRGVDRAFTYRVPLELTDRVVSGSVVRVPFHGREVSGYVLGVQEGPPPSLDPAVIRDIAAVQAPQGLLPADLAEVAHWMQGFYGCLLVEAFQAMIPEPVRAALGARRRTAAAGRIRVATLRQPYDVGAVDALLTSLGGDEGQGRRLIETLQARGALSPPELLAVSHARREVLNRLRDAGVVCWKTVVPPSREASSSTSHAGAVLGGAAVPRLSDAQQRAVDTILAQVASGRPGVVLLHGVTGSGKTEVYLHALEAVIGQGRSGMALVPEISLTPQAVDRYRQRLGERVAVLHSGLTPAERVEAWWSLKEGRMAVALGARSCVFAPLPELGLVIVDEEHETSYKQEQSPRYHARQVAIRRAVASGATVVLGSATPSVESYHWALEGRYTLVEMPQRVEDRPLPEVEVVNLQRLGRRGRERALGHVLRERIRETLARGEQVMLLHNRRGFASFLMCSDCGHLSRCPRCDISFTFHAGPPRLVCHYCLYETAPPSVCGSCGGIEVAHFGAGTQRVEEEVMEAFPEVPLLRMDRDTTRQMSDHRRLLEQFARREAQILVGTQMIAKGHDFPNVTLVGVVLADTALNLPDFRAAERTFSLLTQVAGRAGRGQQRGRVVIQTYNPEHYAIRHAATHQFRAFFDEELAFRRALEYPPFTHLVNVILSGEDAAPVEQSACAMASALRSLMRGLSCVILGPAPCALGRIHRKSRWHLVFKCRRVQEIMPVIRTYLREHGTPGVSVAVDADPVSLL